VTPTSLPAAVVVFLAIKRTHRPDAVTVLLSRARYQIISGLVIIARTAEAALCDCVAVSEVTNKTRECALAMIRRLRPRGGRG